MTQHISQEEYNKQLSHFLAQHEPVTGQLSHWYYLHRHLFHAKLRQKKITVNPHAP
ncbi:MAG: hypothetical protein RBS08_00510 [Bdellovibrionales bacterium]|jgi:hypothetical protein|nr:hypothetical protein [Bdellovibrionales bacterium]